MKKATDCMAGEIVRAAPRMVRPFGAPGARFQGSRAAPPNVFAGRHHRPPWSGGAGVAGQRGDVADADDADAIQTGGRMAAVVGTVGHVPLQKNMQPPLTAWVRI